MGLEKNINCRIQEAFESERDFIPRMEWTHGTLFVDVDDKQDVDMIKEIMQDYTGHLVQAHCMKATTTEPWDQWAFDITGEVIHGS
jgi:hypothetical protein